MHQLNIMALRGGSKLRLDRPFRPVQPSTVKRLLPFFAALCGAARPTLAQAPDWAELWRVAGTTLAIPAALERGPTGVFWNPAAVADVPGLAGGVEALQTPEAVNLSGILGTLTYRIGPAASFGVTAGRVSVGDLVRTSTSPISEEGEIQVFAQFLGAVAGTSAGPLAVGAQLRLHDARLDALSADGVTLDLGFRVDSIGPFVVAAATHFASPRLARRPTTDYFAGAECRVGTSRVWGAPAVVIARYGVGVRASGGVEHAVSGGLAFGHRLRVDAGFQRETAYDRTAWRFAMGLAFRAGRYVIAANRGAGLQDVGATYRIGLSAGVLR
jgi:hypothetical protein